jgi:hypothetical protein
VNNQQTTTSNNQGADSNPDSEDDSCICVVNDFCDKDAMAEIDYGPMVWSHSTQEMAINFIIRRREVDFLFQREINPRKLFSPDDLDALRDLFPEAVGAQLLVTGYLIVLFEYQAQLQAAERNGRPRQVGDLIVLLGLKSCEVTMDVHSGVALMSPDCRVADWVLRAKQALQSYRTPKLDREVPAYSMLREPPSNSPIRKDVWLRGSNRKVRNQMMRSMSSNWHILARFSPIDWNHCAYL